MNKPLTGLFLFRVNTAKTICNFKFEATDFFNGG